MTRNVGPEDRIVRIVVALGLGALIYFAHLSQTADIVVGIVALYLLVTGLVTRCIVYQMAGIDTNIQEQPYSSTDDRAGF
jgi:glucose uptake protein GlcU